ncbi:hypothetical protein POM88_045517 [Heracleum sosnowskyi]|uniref:Uncharacterized protein n=1 Tax=Heracleum sosnowskyi TaxID=360622 RepID=A0AAD8H6M0_9APIA|nr:hypothetical protein POM88_045517 [Heracleum sosnowskyi]
MIWKEHDDRSSLPVAQKCTGQCTEICIKTFLLKSNAHIKDGKAAKNIIEALSQVKDKANIRKSDYKNYITHICRAYTGPNRPGTCSLPPEIIPSNIEPSVSHVCYARKTGNSFSPEEEISGLAKILGRKKTQSLFMSWIHKN